MDIPLSITKTIVSKDNYLAVTKRRTQNIRYDIRVLFVIMYYIPDEFSKL